MDSINNLTKVLDCGSQESSMEDAMFCGGSDEVAVFLCSKCRSPLGDTYSWLHNDEEKRRVILRDVTAKVIVAPEKLICSDPQEYGSLYENLMCAGCQSCVGKRYSNSYKPHDLKRHAFCLDVDAVDGYTLGTPSYQMIPDSEEPLTLEIRRSLEEELAKAKTVLAILSKKLELLESGMLDTTDGTIKDH